MKRVVIFCSMIFSIDAWCGFIIDDVVAKPVSPWNEIVVDYNIKGDLPTKADRYGFFMFASNMTTKTIRYAASIKGNAELSLGKHRVVWNIENDQANIGTKNKIGVCYCRLYCIIDLSKGPNAINYPVSYLDTEPYEGWTSEYKSTKLVLRFIEPGSFKFNGTKEVIITKPYYIGVFEVTQKQFELVTGYRSSTKCSDLQPVMHTSWNEIRGDSDIYDWPTIRKVNPESFIGRLQSKTGLNLDLPMEAQWEYACRAGTMTAYSYGDKPNGDYMWYGDNSGLLGALEVGSRLPNPWGLYDMHGNVWEWCLDKYGIYPNGKIDPISSSSGLDRVKRGGSYVDVYNETDGNSDAALCTSSYRICSDPSHEYYFYDRGFRIVFNLAK